MWEPIRHPGQISRNCRFTLFLLGCGEREILALTCIQKTLISLYSNSVLLFGSLYPDQTSGSLSPLMRPRKPRRRPVLRVDACRGRASGGYRQVTKKKRREGGYTHCAKRPKNNKKGEERKSLRSDSYSILSGPFAHSSSHCAMYPCPYRTQAPLTSQAEPPS